MKDDKTYSYPTDHMLTVGLGFAIFYWVCEFFISMLSAHHGTAITQFFGKSLDDVWTRIVVLCLFMIFGSHAQYTIDKRRQAEESLRRQNEYMEALHETALGIIRNTEPDDLLRTIVSRITALTRIPNAFVYLYDAERDELELKVGTGIFQNQIGLRLKPGEGISGKVWVSGKSMIINNYRNWDERVGHACFDSIRGIMAIPLKSEGFPDGVMGICQTEKGRFVDSENAEMAERFSKLASVALCNARLHEGMRHELELRRQAEDESREMEHHLRRSQKIQALGTLAGGIAHDFNNILGAIIGFSEMAMIFDTAEGSNAKPHLKQVITAGLRAKELVRQILVFGRDDQQDRQIIRISSAIKEVLRMIRAFLPANIVIRREIADDAGYVLADLTEIHQVIMNLCTNAAHAMEGKGGILKVSLSNIEADSRTYPELPHPGDYVCLNVTDTGCGMSPDIIEKVFDPYFTTKEPGKGTGLGLAIAERIVRSHEGAIRIRSTEGEGTEISVLFPLVGHGSDAQSVCTNFPAPGNGRVLFVEDEEMLVELGEHILGKLGYEVAGFESPEAALETFRSKPDSFDIVITDLNMQGMSGIELSRKLRHIRHDIPIILTTGFAEESIPETISEIGIRELLMKPLTIHELADAVRKAIRETC